MSSSAAAENKPTSNETPAPEQKKPTAVLEEDDEFEDFPAEGI
jgi:hypothetical protein